MSQKLRITRQSSVDHESEDFKALPNSENGVGESKSKKALSEPREIKKSSDQKEVKKPSDQKDAKKSPDQKEVKKPAEQKREQKRAASEHKEQKGQKTDTKQTAKSGESKEHLETNGKELTNGDSEKKVTRSSTPQKKKRLEEKVAIKETIQEESEPKEQNVITNGQDSSSNTELNTSSETDKMDPLVLPVDEPDPELEFEESSDMSESGKSGKVSPIINRCTTRRSQSRNLPTPKSPKDEHESDKTSQQTDSGASTPSKMMTRRRNKKPTSDTDDDSMASDSLSTRAEVGSDSTRLDFSNQDSGILDDNSFLTANKDRSVAETLRHLSPRRSIRQAGNDYRKQVLKGNLEKEAYFSYSSSESVTIGLKRKNRSISPVEAKRQKVGPSGLFMRLTSPLLSFRNKFRGDVQTSTPKLTGYKNSDHFENENGNKIGSYGEEDKLNEKRWCSIM